MTPSNRRKEQEKGDFERKLPLLTETGKGVKTAMQNLKRKLNMALFNAKNWISTKKEGSDQLMVMFIIIAVAAGVAGLLYIFAKSTLLPEFQSKVSELLNNWFNHS